MSEINDRLSRIDDTLFEAGIKIKRIDESVKRINTMLEELIVALHNYDDGLEMFDHEPPNEALKEALKQYNEKVAPCVGHDAASWDEEEQLNKRMDIIGQNGNEGIHYVTNEEADEDAKYNDYGMRVVGDKDKDNNTQDKRTVEDRGKKKYNNKYRRQPNTPVTPKKMSVVEHEKHKSPHKH